MIKALRIFGLIGMAIALSLIAGGSPSCGEEPMLSIELQPETSVYDVRMPLGALGRVQGRIDVAYRASRAMVDVSDGIVTIDDVLESLQGAGVGGVSSATETTREGPRLGTKRPTPTRLADAESATTRHARAADESMARTSRASAPATPRERTNDELGQGR